jgi:hypothetical protein
LTAYLSGHGNNLQAKINALIKDLGLYTDLGFVMSLEPVIDLGFDHEFDASHRYRICPGLDKS